MSCTFATGTRQPNEAILPRPSEAAQFLAAARPPRAGPTAAVPYAAGLLPSPFQHPLQHPPQDIVSWPAAAPAALGWRPSSCRSTWSAAATGMLPSAVALVCASCRKVRRLCGKMVAEAESKWAPVAIGCHERLQTGRPCGDMSGGSVSRHHQWRDRTASVHGAARGSERRGAPECSCCCRQGMCSAWVASCSLLRHSRR